MEQKIEQLKEIVREIEARVAVYKEMKDDNVIFQQEIDELNQKLTAIKAAC